jgi:DNA-binding NarL/FixJ family response regulator
MTPAVNPIRILLVDDHPIVLHGLQQFFERHREFQVVGCCADGVSAVEAVARHVPDILLLDLRMPGRSGLDVLRDLAGHYPGCRRILLSAAITDAEVADAVRLGVMGLVMKESSPDALLACVRDVYNGIPCIARDAPASAPRATAADAPGWSNDLLTQREMEILRMVALGLRNKAIAERLSISDGTVKVHLHNIYQKLGVDGRLELVLCAQQKGLL